MWPLEEVRGHEYQEAIAAVCSRQDLYAKEMMSVMRTIMTGEATDAQIGAFLMGLRMKGEAIDEIVGAASVMRELSRKWMFPKIFWLIPVGRGVMAPTSLMFQLRLPSWLPQLVVGLQHGNRSVSSKSGSADVLEASGVCLDLDVRSSGKLYRDSGCRVYVCTSASLGDALRNGTKKELGCGLSSMYLDH